MIQAMLAVPIEADCSSLETIMYGAAPMPEALLLPAMKKFPRASFIQGYGMTETSPAIAMLTADITQRATIACAVLESLCHGSKQE